jgi:hypothetical protein
MQVNPAIAETVELLGGVAQRLTARDSADREEVCLTILAFSSVPLQSLG